MADLSQGKHTDISSCLFELQFKTYSIQLALSESCHSFFSVKYLSCSCSPNQYSGLFICYLLPCQLQSPPIQLLHHPLFIFYKISMKYITLFWKIDINLVSSKLFITIVIAFMYSQIDSP